LKAVTNLQHDSSRTESPRALGSASGFTLPPWLPRAKIMRLRHLLFAFLALVPGGTLYADDWQPDPQFRSLFNGKDLSGWCFRAKVDRKSPRVGEVVEKFDGKTQSSDGGRYSAKDGILTVNFPKGQERLVAQLYTVEEFPKDFVLKLEFRASVNADSG